ncbi:hypothetical protein ACSBR1_002349 [Camellia fascicularis]
MTSDKVSMKTLLQVDETLDLFNELQLQHQAAATKTKTLHDACDRLIKNGKEFLLTDTVRFVQKLPTTLVTAFRATLEKISKSSLLVHVVDISHPLAKQQIDVMDKVLSELDVVSIPKLMVWNKRMDPTL